MNLRIKPKTYGPLLVRSATDEALVIEAEVGYRVGAGHGQNSWTKLVVD